MRWSALFIPTLRQNPAEITGLGCQLLVRAGYVRQASSGVFSYLTLGQRSLRKIVRIVREEMEAIGAQEMQFPVLHRAGEAIASIAHGELRSYRQLPQIWYQVQIKLDGEARSMAELLRGRQSLAVESYSFDVNGVGRDVSYQKHSDVWSKVFSRCGLNYVPAESRAGVIFVAASESGEDVIARCCGCGYAEDLEKATSRASPPLAADPEGDYSPEPFHTPGRRTIADVTEFTGLPATSQMKSLVLVADGNPVLAMMRGDHSLNEAKFAAAIEASEFQPAHADEIRKWFGADAGSLGPIGIKGVRIIADEALRGRRNMIAGANKDDHHLRNVTPGEDFEAEYFDLRQVAACDSCVRCGGALEFIKCIQVGRARKAGCSELDLRVQNEAREETHVMLGSYRIGIDRMLAAIVEQSHDQDGIALRPAVAPFDVVITTVFAGEAPQRDAAERIYSNCRQLGLDPLLDDRDERPGVKFKDADLIGIPYRVTVGKKIAGGMVEVIERRSKKMEEASIEQAAALVAKKACS